MENVVDIFLAMCIKEIDVVDTIRNYVTVYQKCSKLLPQPCLSTASTSRYNNWSDVRIKRHINKLSYLNIPTKHRWQATRTDVSKLILKASILNFSCLQMLRRIYICIIKEFLSLRYNSLIDPFDAIDNFIVKNTL